MTSIGYRAFAGSYLREIIVPSSIRRIGDSAFYGLLINKIVFEKESRLEFIGSRAFQIGQYKLQSIIIPKSVKVIKEHAFNTRETFIIYAEAKKSQRVGILIGIVVNIMFCGDTKKKRCLDIHVQMMKNG